MKRVLPAAMIRAEARRAEPPTSEDLAALAEARLARPKIRAHCQGGERPCPFVSCRHNLALDVTDAGGIRENTLPEGGATCALDVAEEGAHSLSEVGAIIGLDAESVRQIEVKGLRKLRRSKAAALLAKMMAENEEES